MDWLVRAWSWLGECFHRRPVAVTGVVVGALIFGGLMGFLLVKQDENTSRIQHVQEVLCSSGHQISSQMQERNCQQLLNHLLEHPTKSQAERLRQILKETP